MPLLDRHTTANIYSLVTRLLDAMCPSLGTKLLSVCTDGTNSMTGRHASLVTLLEGKAKYPVLRVWCLPPPYQPRDQAHDGLRRWWHVGRLCLQVVRPLTQARAADPEDARAQDAAEDKLVVALVSNIELLPLAPQLLGRTHGRAPDGDATNFGLVGSDRGPGASGRGCCNFGR